ncbi:MAG: hypothetical protein AAB112_00305, partial [Thermodesulfobacteriota bacterium]
MFSIVELDFFSAPYNNKSRGSSGYLKAQWEFNMKYPKKVVLGDITVRDGFQHEGKVIPTQAKLW